MTPPRAASNQLDARPARAAEWALNTNDEFSTLSSQATAWDRFADLLIELALEYDPTIIERVKPPDG